MLALAVLALAGGYLAIFLASRPRAALTFWLAVLAFTPVWITYRSPLGELGPATLAALLVVPAAVRAPGPHRVVFGDRLLLAATAVMLTNVVVFHSPRYMFLALLTEGWTSYLIARRLVPAVGRQFTINVIARGTLLLATWAVVEFAFGLHLFENFHTSSPLTFWSELQLRGGVVRSEAAWGHAIALAAGLSLGLPFVWASTLKYPTLGVLWTLAGAALTISRAPTAAAIIALALSVALLREGVTSGRRFAILFGGAVASFVVLPIVDSFLGTASAELDASGEYRAGLLTHAAEDLHLFGQGDNVSIINGEFFYRGLYTVDNNYLLVALTAGVLTSLLLAAGLVAAAARTISPRRTPADIALACQLLVLATVATITQYQPAIYFVAGVAVSFAAMGTPARRDASLRRRLHREPRDRGRNTPRRRVRQRARLGRAGAVAGQQVVQEQRRV